jgi:hypothetical protein
MDGLSVRDNAIDGLDFTAMKASWLSKLDPRRANGSMVIWLKSKAAADWFLQISQALFGGGADGAFCSKYFQETSTKVCYNCNTYGHPQTNCRRVTRYGNCSGGHQTRDCTGNYCCAKMPGIHGSPHDQRLVLQVLSSAQEVSCSITERISSLTADGVCSEAEPRQQRHREEHSRLNQMIDELSTLHYNVGRRKHAQWSTFNDPGLQDSTALAILGPHIYEEIFLLTRSLGCRISLIA